MSNQIVVVSGLPRSGTSMMMQMVAAGGIPALTDELRKADQNNPQGYFEYEPVKKLASDNSWMGEAKGKCIKIIAQLLPFIQQGHTYKVLFMNREVEEVLRSQQILLGKDPGSVNPVLSGVFSKQVKQVLDWMDAQQEMEYKIINYQDVIADPDASAREISDFLQEKMDIYKMASSVDPELYRNKL